MCDGRNPERPAPEVVGEVAIALRMDSEEMRGTTLEATGHTESRFSQSCAQRPRCGNQSSLTTSSDGGTSGPRSRAAQARPSEPSWMSVLTLPAVASSR